VTAPRHGLLIALAVSALLAACASRPPPPAAPPPAVPPPPAVASCFDELAAHGVTFERVPDFHTAEGCGIDQAVRIDRSAIPWNRPSLASCPFALTEWDFETKVLQPAAQRILGRRVTKLIHAGTYACRGERGGDPNRLSQHAYGKAIDVLGFELDDGSTVSVRKDWSGDGPKARFLREVAKGACSVFSLVITPNHNAWHVDHIHMDTGPYKMCAM